MSRSARGFLAGLAVLACCSAASTQTRRFPQFPPEITLDRFIDVVKVAPGQFRIETDRPEFRVLRAKLAAQSRVPVHDERSGLIIALTEVHLRYTTPDKKFRDIHLAAGETFWMDGDTYSQQNLSDRTCEFLYVESKPPAEKIPDNPPA